MISPVGSFIVNLDTTLMGGIDGIVSAMQTWVSGPATAALCIYVLILGVRFASGDPGVVHGLVPRLVRVAIIMWLATDLTAYNTYVRDYLCTTIPNALTSVVTNSQGGSSDVTSVAAAFNQLYASVNTTVSYAWQSASISITGLGVILAGLAAIVSAGLGLVVMSVVFIAARLMIAAIVCLGPLLIACGLFEWSRVFLERAIGKIVSLILMQVVGFLFVSIMISISQRYMVSVSNDSISAAANSEALPQLLMDLMSLVVWFIACGFATMFLSHKVAYSIGTGVSLSGPSALTAWMVGKSIAEAAGGGGGGGGGRSQPSAPSPNYQLSMPRPQLSSNAPALPAPPPPPPPIRSSRS